MGTQKILLRLHWSTLNHCGPLLRLPAHAGDSDVPADLVESLLHQHDMPQFAVLQHILLGRQPPRSWLERAAEEPGLLLWLLMSRQALFEVEDPWRVGIRVVDDTLRHGSGAKTPSALRELSGRMMHTNCDSDMCTTCAARCYNCWDMCTTCVARFYVWAFGFTCNICQLACSDSGPRF